MTAPLSAEARVKATYPDANAETPLGWITFIYVGKSLQLLGIGDTPGLAWQDAASRIEAQEEEQK